MSEPSLSCEHRVRLAELAMQLALAGINDVAVWNRHFKSQPPLQDNATALHAFDVIYLHLLDKVGMDAASTAAPTSGPSTA